MIRGILAAAVVLALALPAAAHKESDAYLALALGAGVAGVLDLHVSDLDAALGLDADRDGVVRKGEVREAEARIDAYVAERLRLSAGGAPCALMLEQGGFVQRTDGPYLSLPLRAECGEGALSLSYAFFFDIDMRHRGRLKVTGPEGERLLVLSPGATQAVLTAPAQSWAEVAGVFLWQGVLHILEGTDHVLFVLTLLLSAARTGGPGEVVRRVAGVVTAFTLSHSVTLALAAFGILRPDPALIEAAIAATVVLAALNVVWPVVTRDLFGVALAFGFIHGFGFANVLAELDLPREAFAVALFAFNLGVEAGQLMIVALVLPLLLLARLHPPVLRWTSAAGALAIAAIAALWFSDRAFGTAIGLI